MLFLWVFGGNVEESTGPLSVLGLLPPLRVTAAVAQAMMNTGSTLPMVGASRAILVCSAPISSCTRWPAYGSCFFLGFIPIVAHTHPQSDLSRSLVCRGNRERNLFRP